MKTQCETCKHYFGLGQCAAFDQIPEVITLGEYDHRQPFDGDRGILWEPAAERKAGDMLRQLERSNGGRPAKTSDTLSDVSEKTAVLNENSIPNTTAPRGGDR